MASKIVEFLFPKRCALCRCFVENELEICPACMNNGNIVKALPPIPPIPYVDVFVTAAWYDGAVRKAIHRFKFNGFGGYARPFAYLLYRQYVLSPYGYDYITWVPSNRRTEFRRGYNQARLLAKELGKLTGKPTVAALKKVRRTRAMFRLNAAERAENVAGAYVVTKQGASLAGKRVLLVDDVLTTGSTVSECARVLRQAGCDFIGVYTIAHKKLK